MAGLRPARGDVIDAARHARVVLASASPARRETLRRAGVAVEVQVSGVDESGVTAGSVRDLVATLADLKATAVADRLDPDEPRLVIGCDSLLDLDGRPHGKPADAAEATARWRSMRGRSGLLHTGHRLILLGPDGRRSVGAVASTTVHFADLDDAEIDAYVATGEPLAVAGAFTVDGLGGAFVREIAGDHHNVVGISLPLLRTLVADLGLSWVDLWTPSV